MTVPQSVNFFPPAPAYPTAIDSDYTLFLAHNTTEARLAADNEGWSDEIDIVPVAPGALEVWPGNGFATIEGELFYYDAVDLDNHGKVNRLRRCARSLGGIPTRSNPKGSWVRGFVVAEHHNQLAAAVEQVEDFVGINYDTRVATLDYRIRNLRSVPVIFDDWSCPDVSFSFVTLQDDPAGGVLISYEVSINGTYADYKLDFGDGTFTTTEQTGTHRYSFNSSINPVVTVVNELCTQVQSPIQRTDPTTPQLPGTTLTFDPIVPELPTFPSVTIPETPSVQPQIDIPPLVTPCLDLQPFQGISIGDISIGPISVPSHIVIDDPHIPSQIIFTPLPKIPSVISITPVQFASIPPISWADPPSLGPIEFGPAPSIGPIDISIDINIDATAIPSCISLGCDQTSIMVDWGAPPTLNVAFVAPLAAQSARRKATFDPDLARELGSDYTALFEEDEPSTLQVEYDAVGIPSEIRIVPPQFPDIKIDHNIPTEIKLGGLEVPKEIRITGLEIPKEITVSHDIPSKLVVEHDIPEFIRIDASAIPERIELVVIDTLPDVIRVDASGIPDSIKLVGAPEFIELRGPDSIKLVLDDDIEVPLVYRQGPIDVKVELDMQKLLGVDENGENPCVMIVPCPKR